ncbi:MAG TPA: SDR family NAD(P)-dependent oxidoreductase [Nannocystaceae bacterium]|nr:SDR family NAD(P)-dependent oxidoreductase [Nannocystaceae bacterium]
MSPRYDGALVATVGGILDRVRGRRSTLQLSDRDRLDGKTCLVTGANRGLGLAIASAVAERGAHVVLACRSAATATRDVVRTAAVPGARVDALHLDLGDLARVDAAADEIARGPAPIDVLVLNAGIVPGRARRTKDGFDEGFQVNFLANVLFVRRLVERGVLSCAPGLLPRIVVVSSESHRSSPPIDWASLGVFREWGMRDAVEQYGYGKLLLQTFAEELARRLRGRASVHSLCPGAVRSDIGRDAPRWAKPALAVVMRAFFAAPTVAAVPVVWLAAARAIEGDTGIYLHAHRRRDPRDDARDPDSGRRIWNEAERILAAAGHVLAEEHTR